MNQTNTHKKYYNVIGMMSGTSLDGVDLSYANYFCQKNKWKYQLYFAKTYSYTPQIIQIIHKTQDNLESITFLQFHNLQLKYTKFLSQLIAKFIQQFQIIKQKCDFIAVHGHTVYHQPQKLQLTTQITDLTYLAASLELNIIGNFRQLDVYRGGQGAPLAPYAQQLFLQIQQNKSQQDVVFLNLGGIANVGNKSKGTDINFCNMFFNHFSYLIQQKQYDLDGNLGKQGSLKPDLMQFFIQIFSSNNFNKERYSLAKQDFQVLLSTIKDKYQVKFNQKTFLKDLMNTFYNFLAKDIILKIKKIVNLKQISVKKVNIICTGGGTYNKFLIKLMQSAITQNNLQNQLVLIIPQKSVIQFKQSILFGLLGVKYMQNIRNCQHGIGGTLVKGKM